MAAEKNGAMWVAQTTACCSRWDKGSRNIEYAPNLPRPGQSEGSALPACRSSNRKIPSHQSSQQRQSDAYIRRGFERLDVRSSPRTNGNWFQGMHRQHARPLEVAAFFCAEEMRFCVRTNPRRNSQGLEMRILSGPLRGLRERVHRPFGDSTGGPSVCFQIVRLIGLGEGVIPRVGATRLRMLIW